MVKACAAYNCTKRYGARNEDGTPITFHDFPKDPEKAKKWLAAVRREDLMLERVSNSKYYLCSQHFLAKDYKAYGQRRRLEEDVVPSVFSFPEHLIPASKRRKVPKVREVANVHEKENEPEDVGNENQHEVLASCDAVPATEEHGYAHKIRSTEVIFGEQKQLQEKLRKVRYERKCLRQKLKARDRRLTSLKATISVLRQDRLVDGDVADMLQGRFENQVVSELFKNEIVNGCRKKRGRRYSDEVKRFCLTINFYSPRAYSFLARNFALPSKTSIKDWTKSVNCDVGILSEVLDKLAQQVKTGVINPHCSLLVDDMSIRKGLVYNHAEKKFVGHVDLGAGEMDDASQATNALMFMAVGLKGQWRHPVAYFLTDHLASDSLAELTRSLLGALAEAGLKVKVMVADGLKANINMFSHLGAKFDAKNQNTGEWNSFIHPTTGEKVYILLDVVHMMKLLRNLLGDKIIMLDGKQICWTYIQALYDLQHQEGIRAANKLSKKHVDYTHNKMKVKLAVQVFSNSVGKALQYLVESGHPQFAGAGPTADFILEVDRAFDYMNGCSPLGKGYKSPMTHHNYESRREALHEFADMLRRLRTVDGQPILHSQRYTAVMGLSLAAKTIPDVAEYLLKEVGYEYVLPYRMSQDHLELHFGRIRRTGGFNNNPNAWQLRQAMRKLVLHNFVTPSFSGNCTPREQTDDGLLQIRRPSRQRDDEPSQGLPAVVEHILDRSVPSSFVLNCTAYVAGYVCKKVVQEKLVQCPECVGRLLTSDHDPPPPEVLELVKVRDNGGLLIPSGSVFRVIMSAEKHFASFQKCMDVSRERMLSLRIQASVLRQLGLESTQRLFPGSEEHMFLCPGKESHLSQLVKIVVRRYLRVRLYDYAKVRTQSMQGNVHKRHKLTKVILFSNQ